jgi:DNA (cytosine-5)-methyltransferase 1
MKFLSVCSGIEAASVAWKPLGWKAWAFSEIEPFPCDLLAHHYPDVPNLGDMTKFEEWPIPDEPIDLLCGGTPCQSFSVAGLRKGLDDERGNLMLTFARIAARYRPRWLVWENVPGVLSSNAGRDFAAFLGLITGQRVEPPTEGWSNSGILPGYRNAYSVAWRTLDAQYFGVAQRRRRVFVVGHLGDWRRAAAVLLERHSLQGHPAPRRETRQNVTGTLSARTQGGGGLGTDFDLDGGIVAGTLNAAAARSRGAGQDSGMLIASTGDIAHCLNAGGMSRQDFETETLITCALRGEGFDASKDGTGRGTPLVPVSVALRGRDGDGTIEMGDEIAHALRASQGGGDKPHVLAFSAKDHGADAMLDLAPTLRAGGHASSHANAGVMPAICFDPTQITSRENRSNPQPGEACHTLAKGAYAPAIALAANIIGRKPENGGNGTGYHIETAYTLTKSDQHGVAHGAAVRRLTPRECERLQGFPDDYTLIPRRSGQWQMHKGVAVRMSADGPRYKALGNSWAVPCARWIGERIAAVDAIPYTNETVGCIFNAPQTQKEAHEQFL